MRGFTPAPHQGFHPWTQQRNLLILSNEQFPAGALGFSAARRRRKCFCKLEAALPPHGLGGGTPPAGCFCIRGKYTKWRERKQVFSFAIFVFSLCPWALFPFLRFYTETRAMREGQAPPLRQDPRFMRKQACSVQIVLRPLGAGRIALPWGQRGRAGPLGSSP